ncbi:MAG TPA: hypothetical protein VKB80_31950 [Kofleriaceae bacterium]|nr:hypothetical protein [Kofleriaceae bacterium]
MGATSRVVVRAAGLIGAALTCWSNNVQWGTGPGRGGPPGQWERAAVGAALLSLLAALAVWLATRPGASRTWLRIAACLCALGVAAIAYHLRAEAEHLRLPNLMEGPGWTWMAAGAGFALAAAAATFAVRGSGAAGASQRSRARRRGAGQRGR